MAALVWIHVVTPIEATEPPWSMIDFMFYSSKTFKYRASVLPSMIYVGSVPRHTTEPVQPARSGTQSNCSFRGSSIFGTTPLNPRLSNL